MAGCGVTTHFRHVRIDPRPQDTVIVGMPHFKTDQHGSQRQRQDQQPDWIDGQCCQQRGCGDERARPDEFRFAANSEDVAEKKEVANDKGWEPACGSHSMKPTRV